MRKFYFQPLVGFLVSKLMMLFCAGVMVDVSETFFGGFVDGVSDRIHI